jgi:hypothetical protein
VNPCGGEAGWGGKFVVGNVDASGVSLGSRRALILERVLVVASFSSTMVW